MKYRIWDNKISKIVEAGSMGSAWLAAEDDFTGSFEIERLDNWDCDTEVEKDLLNKTYSRGVFPEKF
jgi:hypothetical protein